MLDTCGECAAGLSVAREEHVPAWGIALLDWHSADDMTATTAAEKASRTTLALPKRGMTPQLPGPVGAAHPHQAPAKCAWPKKSVKATISNPARF